MSGALVGRVALVTGATRGIGHAVALALGGAGAHIIAIGRTQGGLEALDDSLLALGGERATLVPMDLMDGGGIDQLGYAVHQRHGRLDILIHAAGLLQGLRPAAHIPPAVWDRVIATNLTSAFRLIRSLETLLHASDAGRAVFFTAEQATRPTAFWGSYAAAKAGLEALVRCWADEVETTSAIRTLLVDPGAVRTKLRAEAYPGEDKDALTSPGDIGAMVLDLVQRSDPGQPIHAKRYADWKAERESHHS